jgi:ribosomal protein S18 acetylase RimI-like enzyme
MARFFEAKCRNNPIEEKKLDITIEPMRQDDIPTVADLMARAYSTSPLNLAAMGTDLDLYRNFMKLALEKLGGQTYIARNNDQIVGGMRMVKWPDCQLPPGKMLPLLPKMIMILRGKFLRVMKWIPVWAKKDPKESHWHFGPFSVLPELQGQGIGSQLLTYFCKLVDEEGEAAYLETDKTENVRLYQRFGFQVTSETPVLGVPNWFMWRAGQAKQ